MVATLPLSLLTQTDVPTFRSGVLEVEVPVVVRDLHGRAIAGLRQEDFQLFDRSRLQQILRFTVTGAQTEAAPTRSFVYVIGDYFVAPTQLEWVRDAATRHLTKRLGLGDQAAILFTSGRPAIEYSADADVLRESLSKVVLPIVPGVPTPIRQVPGARSGTSFEYVGEMIRDFGRHSLEALRDGVRRLATRQGERRLVLVSDGFQAKDFTLSANPSLLSMLPPLPIGQLPSIRVAVGLVGFEDAVIQEAIRARVVISCIDARGLQSANDWMGISQDKSAVLAELARGTGGLLLQRNDIDAEFQHVTESEPGYILAFSPRDLKRDGAVHPLKVVLKGHKSLDVQARIAYVAPSQ